MVQKMALHSMHAGSAERTPLVKERTQEVGGGRVDGAGGGIGVEGEEGDFG